MDELFAIFLKQPDRFNDQRGVEAVELENRLRGSPVEIFDRRPGRRCVDWFDRLRTATGKRGGDSGAG
jgi:hypothetical protein